MNRLLIPGPAERVNVRRHPRTISLMKYYELYKNGAFPIDLEMAKSDHDFLDNDVCKAFLRRLKVLNKYSTIVIPNRDILRRNYLKMTL